MTLQVALESLIASVTVTTMLRSNELSVKVQRGDASGHVGADVAAGSEATAVVNLAAQAHFVGLRDDCGLDCEERIVHDRGPRESQGSRAELGSLR